jgi:hypothetical protein
MGATPQLLTVTPQPSATASGDSLAPDGRTLVFASYSGDPNQGDFNRDQDLFMAKDSRCGKRSPSRSRSCP